AMVPAGIGANRSLAIIHLRRRKVEIEIRGSIPSHQAGDPARIMAIGIAACLAEVDPGHEAEPALVDAVAPGQVRTDQASRRAEVEIRVTLKRAAEYPAPDA